MVTVWQVYGNCMACVWDNDIRNIQTHYRREGMLYALKIHPGINTGARNIPVYIAKIKFIFLPICRNMQQYVAFVAANLENAFRQLNLCILFTIKK